MIKLIPKQLRNKILAIVKKITLSGLEQEVPQIPKQDLKRKHLENTKLLVNRKELLERLPKGGIVAELGVDEGTFSKMILDICKPQKLHLIDYWGSERYHQDKRKKVENQFATEIKEQTVEINLGLSTQIVHDFHDDYFDWIYIDTDHSYQTTIAELESYRKKVKQDGIIAGHDYIIGNWDGRVKYGVIEAVHEFCVKYNWEIIFLSTELTGHPSFAIKRLHHL